MANRTGIWKSTIYHSHKVDTYIVSEKYKPLSRFEIYVYFLTGSVPCEANLIKRKRVQLITLYLQISIWLIIYRFHLYTWAFRPLFPDINDRYWVPLQGQGYHTQSSYMNDGKMRARFSYSICGTFCFSSYPQSTCTADWCMGFSL